MRSKKISVGLTVVLAMFSLTTLMAVARAVAQETVLYNFDCSDVGCEPASNLIFDAAGNLYGTSPYGGNFHNGVVFELSPQTSGGWGLAVLHSFNNATGDGYLPQGGLVSDAAGNLYGTTQYGGVRNGGTVFELTPSAGGGWTETLLHSFGTGMGGADGNGPYAGLIFDAAGNLYGTTTYGGTHKLGIAFELTPGAGGVWTEKILHTFSGPDGGQPHAGLTLDAAGNLYGTAISGGAYNGGTVFQLTPQANGQWAGKLLHSIGQVNGNGVSIDQPYGGVVFDQAGNLYGTTYYGGGSGGGVVYKLTPSTGGPWKETSVHNLGGAVGANSLAGVVFDSVGNLYGTTLYGGNEDGDCGSSGCGVVFELRPTTGGSWTESVLVGFNYADGGHPSGSLIFDTAGNLYGTTSAGGSGVFGTVFKIAH